MGNFSNVLGFIVLLGFAFGVIVAVSVFVTLDIYGYDTTFINSEVYTCLFVAGVTNAIITYFARSCFNVSNPSTERNDDDDKLLVNNNDVILLVNNNVSEC